MVFFISNNFKVGPYSCKCHVTCTIFIYFIFPENVSTKLWTIFECTGVFLLGVNEILVLLVLDGIQRVVVDGEVSSRKSVLSGVPQRSTLGPILYLAFINDLEEGVTRNILKISRSQQCGTRSGLRAGKIKDVATMYNKTKIISYRDKKCMK